jgi:hypothetical protein
VRLAEALAARQRNAAHLALLGAALYRAGRFRGAARTLEEAIRAHGKGGEAESWLFLALARRRMGQPEDARRWLARVEGWLKKQQFKTWQRTIYWRLLSREARDLILRMPRVPDER